MISNQEVTIQKAFLPLALALTLAPCGAVAEERKTTPTASFTLDENGLPIVSVTLHSMKSWNVTKTFRFLLDTGAGWCIVDRSVPTEFFWEEPQTETTTLDIANQPTAAPTVLLKRIEVGGVTRDGIIATRMDLRNQIGRFQDQPVDGILGMSFLRGTRFLLDPKASRLVWWDYHFSPGVTVPMSEGLGGPFISLRLGKLETQATVDTGMSGSVDLPMALQPKGDALATISIGLSGARVAGSEVVVNRLEAGPGAWVDLPVGFQAEGKTGGIGVGVLLAAPVCFDFITNHLTLSLDAEGHLPILREPSRKLPLMWDRGGEAPRLIVFIVKPGSAMEKAGCKVSDEVIKAGDLKAPALTRRAVQDLVASGVKHAWTVRREGQDTNLAFGAN